MAMAHNDLGLLESLCLAGMVPVLCRLTQQPHTMSVRQRAAEFVHLLCFKDNGTMAMFIACQVSTLRQRHLIN